MLTVFKQVFVLFVFAFAGYILSKTKKVKSDNASMLSALLVYVFFPCKVFKSFAGNISAKTLIDHTQIIVVSAVVLTVIIILATFVAKLLTKDDYERRVLKYSMTIANSGYMGYALIEALYGESALFEMVIYMIPVSIYIYTGGYCLLLEKKLTAKKLFNSVTLAMLLGLTAGLLNLKLPDIVLTIVTQSGNCTGPVSMLVLGIAISEYDFKEILLRRNIYIVSFIRLIVIPVAVGLILKTLIGPQIVLPAVATACMPCGLNGVVFPKLLNKDCRTGAGLVLVSTMLACITIPICVYFLIG